MTTLTKIFDAGLVLLDVMIWIYLIVNKHIETVKEYNKAILQKVNTRD